MSSSLHRHRPQTDTNDIPAYEIMEEHHDAAQVVIDPNDENNFKASPPATNAPPKTKTKTKKHSKTHSKKTSDIVADQDSSTGGPIEKEIQPKEVSSIKKKSATKKAVINSASSAENIVPENRSKAVSRKQAEDGLENDNEENKPDVQNQHSMSSEVISTPKQQHRLDGEGSERLTPPAEGSSSQKKTKKSTAPSISAMLINKIASAPDQSDWFQAMTSVTEDEVEACYPSVSIIANAVRSGCPIIPDKKILNGYFAEESERLEEGDLQQSVVSGTDSSSVPLNAERLRDAMLAGAFMNNVEIVDECIKKGANIFMAEASGRNILHYLATGGHSSLAKKVIKKMEKVGKHDTVEESRSRFVETLNKKDKTGWTPLIVAVCRNQLSMADLLLSYPEVDPNLRLNHSCPPSQGSENTESSAIHFAAIQANAQMIKKFIEKGIPMNSKDSMDRTIFHYIGANKNSVQAAACLATMMAEPKFDARYLQEKDNHGRDPLFVAIASGATELATQMMRVLRNFYAQRCSDSFEVVDDKSVDSAQSGDKWSLSDAVLSPDKWGLAAVQVAHLRRHYEMIYHLGQVWPGFRNESSDEETLLAALTKKRPIVQEDSTASTGSLSPSIMLDRVLKDQEFWTDWLRSDLSVSELNTLELIKKALLYIKTAHANRTLRTQLKMSFHDGRQGLTKENMLIRAVHRCGRDVMIKSLENLFTIELNNFFTNHHGAAEPPNKVYDPETHYLQSLKAFLFKSLPEPEAQISWKYIAAAKPTPATKNFARISRQNSHPSVHGGFRESPSSVSPENAACVPSFAAAIQSKKTMTERFAVTRTSKSKVTSTSSSTVQRNRVFASARGVQHEVLSPELGVQPQLRSAGAQLKPLKASRSNYDEESVDGSIYGSVVPHFAAPIKTSATYRPTTFRSVSAHPATAANLEYRSVGRNSARTMQTSRTMKTITKRFVQGEAVNANGRVSAPIKTAKTTIGSSGPMVNDNTTESEEDLESSSIETKSSMTGLESSVTVGSGQ